MATKIVTYSSKSIGDTWFATEANQLKDVINSNVSAFLDHTGSASVHRAIDDSASGATDLWSAQKIQTELTGKAAAAHIHDDRYYTESEVDALISGFSSGGSEFADNVFRVYDSDATGREIAFNASAITSPNTRNIIMADQDIDLEPGATYAAANGTNGITVESNGNIKLGGSLAENTVVGASGDPYTLTMGGLGISLNSGLISNFNSGSTTTIQSPTIRLQGTATGHDLYLGNTSGQDVYIFCDGFVGSANGYLLKLADFATGRIEYDAPEFASNIFAILDNSDNTKKIDFDAASITTATTRTITMPDQDVDLTPGTGTFAAAADKSIGGEVVADGTALTVTNGLAYFPVPTAWNGLTVSRVFIYTPTAGTGTGTTTIRFYNVTQATDLFTTSPSIDPTENGSDTAATAYVIDSGVTLATDDIIRVDCTAITGTTAAEGLTFTLEVA